MNDITSYMLEQTKKILSIDSPTGFTAHAAEYVLGAYKKLGYDAKLTNKGGIFVCVNDGPDQADDPADAPILLEAHMDTLCSRRHESKQCRGGKLPRLHQKRQGLFRHVPIKKRLDPCKRQLQ